MQQIYFSPLQGYTEDAYRRIHNELVGGVATYYTPFLRLEHGKTRSKDMRDINPEYNKGVNVIPQIIASSAEELSTLFDVVSGLNRYDAIDINMGCPFPLQTRHGRGAGLLSAPEKVKEILAEVARLQEEWKVKNAPEKNGESWMKVSVKMRLGLVSPDEWKTILPLLNEAELSHITLHPRIGSQQYKGKLFMQAFEEFRNECRHPLIYNGDITSLDDIRRVEEQYPDLKGIMIGRGLLARPSLAAEYAEGREWDRRRRLELATEMHRRLLAHYENVIPGETQLLSKIRTFWEYMEPELGKKAYKKIMKSGNMKNYLKAVGELHLA